MKAFYIIKRNPFLRFCNACAGSDFHSGKAYLSTRRFCYDKPRGSNACQETSYVKIFSLADVYTMYKQSRSTFRAPLT